MPGLFRGHWQRPLFVTSNRQIQEIRYIAFTPRHFYSPDEGGDIICGELSLAVSGSHPVDNPLYGTALIGG